MAMSSGFFESNIDDSGEYDRVYHAEEFSHYFSQFIGNGVFGNPTNQLKIESLDAHSMEVMMRTGNAFINGYWFKSTENETIKISNASGVMARYDAIVLRCSALNRSITLEVKEGAYAENPVKPTITQNEDTYELCLAYIYVGQNAVEITGANIEDTRPDENLCGFVTALVQQLETHDLFNQYRLIFDTWFANTKAELEGIINEVIQDPSANMQGFTLLFNSWFDTVKGNLTADNAGSITLRIDKLEKSMYGYESKRTEFEEDGNILEIFSSGRMKTTTFNVDGSITERTYDPSNLLLWKKTTTFNSDGSISEEVD